ncbi:unnamed protein product [Bursaphelenchus xylophilus]|uniref:(pine wood nematode) hypothetical protein n=1 Tax=Bursaphelenchus xylophilus TaxID=6326 RepID=A0A1I7SCK6_BURXY|nr:unnamed protein product [Bursaphelenchus xylophilus]CAG9093936.1 unnamed protein product [Bursaphelenchus xylophilus]
MSSYALFLLLALPCLWAKPASTKDGLDFPEFHAAFNGDKFPAPPKILPLAPPPPPKIVPMEQAPDEIDEVLENLKHGQEPDVIQDIETLRLMKHVLSKREFYMAFKVVMDRLNGKARKYALEQQQKHAEWINRLNASLGLLSQESVATLLKLDAIYRNDEQTIADEEKRMADVVKDVSEAVREDLRVLGFKLPGL